MKTFPKVKCNWHQRCECVVNIPSETNKTAAVSHQLEKHLDCFETLRHNLDKQTPF